MDRDNSRNAGEGELEAGMGRKKSGKGGPSLYELYPKNVPWPAHLAERIGKSWKHFEYRQGKKAESEKLERENEALKKVVNALLPQLDLETLLQPHIVDVILSASKLEIFLEDTDNIKRYIVVPVHVDPAPDLSENSPAIQNMGHVEQSQSDPVFSMAHQVGTVSIVNNGSMDEPDALGMSPAPFDTSAETSESTACHDNMNVDEDVDSWTNLMFGESDAAHVAMCEDEYEPMYESVPLAWIQGGEHAESRTTRAVPFAQVNDEIPNSNIGDKLIELPDEYSNSELSESEIPEICDGWSAV